MNQSILYFIIAIAIAFVLAAFLYFFPKKKKTKLSWLLFLLRFLSLLAILTLLINPKQDKFTYTTVKPQLILAVDNTASIKFLGEEQNVNTILKSFKNNTDLQNKFDVKYYSFGEQTSLLDSLSFDQSQTNPTSVLRQIEDLAATKTPVVLVTDGNQTLGNSYKYFQSKNLIYPLVIGDTLSHADLEITRINTNAYSFLDNKFPVEIFTLYKGSQNTESQISIYKNKKRIFTKKLHFSAQNTTQNISVLLASNTLGNQYYKVVLRSLKNEKNTQNNQRDFSVEVVDQQTNVLILSPFLHPDLGALKKSIESNKQRKASIVIGGANTIDFSNYQLVVLYQPSADLNAVIKQIKSNKIGSLLITGTKTDWRYLNSFQNSFSKKFTKIEENYLAVYNTSFSKFVSKDINFTALPPLVDQFGSLRFNIPYQSLLFQKIGMNETESPLLALYTSEQQKMAVLFGEGFWRWRAFSKIEKQSFKEFDDFWGGVFQYLASNKHKEQLHLDYKKICFSNEKQQINANLVDENFKIDTQASLTLILKEKETNHIEKFPFSLEANQYQLLLSNLKPGEYGFHVKVADKKVSTSGSFKVLDYQVEQQFTGANKVDLQLLAINTGGKVYTPNQTNDLLQDFIDDTKYQAVQKSKKISQALIDWYWLLGFIILSLSIEWFIRKYKGLI